MGPPAGREGSSAAVRAPERPCSECVEKEPELVISSELGHRRAGHYQEQLSLGAVINCPDFSLQPLLVAQAGSKHSASGASPVVVGLVTALVRAQGARSAQVSWLEEGAKRGGGYDTGQGERPQLGCICGLCVCLCPCVYGEVWVVGV